MFIPDVINTLLMGLIFVVVIVTIVRPFVLNMVGQAASNSDMQRAAVDAVEREMMRKAELFESQRAEKIKYQMMLLEKPEKPKPKPVVEPEPEPPAVEVVWWAEGFARRDLKEFDPAAHQRSPLNSRLGT